MILRKTGIATWLALMLTLLAAQSASAEFELDKFEVRNSYANGATDVQAGSHPFEMTTELAFHTHVDPETGLETPDENPRDIEVALPPGFSGNPTATPRCTLSQLVNFGCPDDTAVGVIDTDLVGVGSTGPIPVYNIQPPPGVPGRFAFTILSAVVNIDAHLRTGSDYGISVTIRDIPETLTMRSSTLTLWGVPADPGHDSLRGSCAVNILNESEGGECPSDADPKPFLTLPTDCSAGPLEFIARADSWLHTGDWKPRSDVTELEDGTPFGVDGCAALGFDPSISAAPETAAADTPSGLSVDLSVPQSELASGLASAHLMRSVSRLPEGVRINPAAANGLGACAPAQIALGDGSVPTCPASSKIGTVEIITPLLPTPLQGWIYQAKQGDNPFGSNLAFYTYSEGEGVAIKLAAEVHSDPATGQVTTTFEDNPQLPFSHYRLTFFGGAGAPLTMPRTCGSFTVTEQASPWSASDPDNPTAAETISSSDSFSIDSGPGGTPCPPSLEGRPFAPSFTAGTTNPIAGDYSPFTLRFSRADGTQEITGLEVTLPPGMLAKLRGLAYCPEASIAAARVASGGGEAASSSCPAASEVGTLRAGAGAGPAPYYVAGHAYLAGPYRGAPLSLVLVTPALAGPFDLGTVVVRAGLFVDPVTTRVHVESDPIPSSLEVGGDGFPLDLRSVEVDLDRGEFTVNPTSCEPMSVSGRLGSPFGAGADVSERFRVGACAALAFQPKLALRLKGSMRRGGNPSLRATLTMPAGSANVTRATVALPRSEFLDQAHIRTVCTRVQYAAGGGGGAECPAGAIYGRATVYSPLLDQPLSGPVYLRSSSNPLPDLVAALHGQIDVDLSGRIDSKDGGIRATFDAVPDAPVTKFVLAMQGGKKGLLENSTDICHGEHRATVQMDGQNGKVNDFRPLLKANCGKKSKPHKRSGR